MKEKIERLVKLAEKYKWFLLVIFIIGGTFYWYEYRSTQIRKKCFSEVLKNDSISRIGPSGVFRNQYQACLAKYGLER